VLDSVAAATPNADHLDLCLVNFVNHFDGHVSLLLGGLQLPVVEKNFSFRGSPGIRQSENENENENENQN